MNNTTHLRRIATLLSIACFVGCFITAWPLLAQAGDSITDALQTERISSIGEQVRAHEILIAELNSKVTYSLGGIAGMYALLGVIGLFNMRLIKK
jgi:hypothetical protein